MKRLRKIFGRFMRLQPLIAVSMIAISLTVTVVVSTSLFGKFKQLTADNSVREIQNTLDQVSANAQLHLEQLIQDYLFLESILVDNEGVVDSNVKDRFQTMYDTKGDIVAITVFDLSGNIVLSIPNYEVKTDIDISEQEWFQDAIYEDRLFNISNPALQEIYKYNYKWTYAITGKVKSNDSSALDSLIVRIDMDFSQISKICTDTSLQERGYIFLVDAQDNLLYHPDQSVIRAGQTNDAAIQDYKNINENGFYENKANSTLVTLADMNYVNWFFVGVSFEDETARITQEVIQYTMLMMLIAILIIIILSIFIARQISRPVQQLESSMRQVTAGNLETRISIYSSEREVRALTKSFNHMVSRIQKLIKENEKEQELKRKSDLDALQAQINPHFLYNTLDSVVWMAECDQNDEVIQMVNALAMLFRISTSGGKNMITLEDELNHARNYMLIQQHRYTDKFDFEIEVEDAIKELLVPKIILQPLIENSIYHGVRYLVDPGIIKITAEVKDDLVYIYIFDNGNGMTEDELENIWNKKPKKNRGVGIRNVRDRIQLMMGKEYGLSYISKKEEGTTAIITLPTVRNEDSDDA